MAKPLEVKMGQVKDSEIESRIMNRHLERERKKEKRRRTRLLKQRREIRKIARRVNNADLYGL